MKARTTTLAVALFAVGAASCDGQVGSNGAGGSGGSTNAAGAAGTTGSAGTSAAGSTGSAGSGSAGSGSGGRGGSTNPAGAAGSAAAGSTGRGGSTGSGGRGGSTGSGGAAGTAMTSVPMVGACSSAMQGTHATYDVGPGKTYADLSTVPWLSLQAGDVVNVYYRSDPYRTYVALKAQGTAANPVVINGVTDASCNRPIISAQNATDAADQRTGYHDSFSHGLGTVLIWSGTGNANQKPKFITIQNLEIVASPIDQAGLYAVVVEDLLVQNCGFHENMGGGVFVNTKNEDALYTSYRVTIRASRLYNNGQAGSYLYHNLYIQSYGALYEGNYIGQLVPDAQGSSLKDRSSGTVVRYNHIVAAARAIDLVETEEGFTTIGKDPLYNEAWVYGNLIINDDSNRQLVASGSLVHWGYDNTLSRARKGTLHFFNNTVLSRNSTDGYVSLFDQQSSSIEMSANNTVEMQNNIVSQTGSAKLALTRDYGTVNVIGTNWISTGWGKGDPSGNSVTLNMTGTVLTGTDPMLNATSHRPVTGSPVIGAAAGTPPKSVVYEFHDPLGVAARATALDLGAFEH